MEQYVKEKVVAGDNDTERRERQLGQVAPVAARIDEAVITWIALAMVCIALFVGIEIGS